ncbi:MAG: rhodanese-like domain-containing protein [Rhizobiales bacterium]|nr:rhodanese-like domain-containing protein [Hyphomicrobiales bacterium]
MKTLFAMFFAAFTMVAMSAMASTVSPTLVEGATTVNAEQAKELFEAGVVFVDVRKDGDWEAGRVPGAYHLELKSAYNEGGLSGVVAKDAKVVIYCNGDSCMRSSEACAQAVGWGFKNVYYFRDGFPAWASAGYPVE